MRKQLDELMGVNRNGDRPELEIKHFWDKRLCKYDLLGLCPYQLFPNTKFNIGKCPAAICPVPDKFKKEYQEERKRKDYGYEKDLQVFLERLVRDCDDRINKAKKRLEQQQLASAHTIPEELINIRKELDEMTKQVEKLGEEGLVDEAAELAQKIEVKKKEKEVLEQKATTKEQQLTVCEICGGMLSVNETDQRLADHFAGKSHQGFDKIREKLKQLREITKLEDDRRRSKERYRDDDRYYDRRYDRGYDRYDRGYRRRYRDDDRYDRRYDDRYDRKYDRKRRRERSYSPSPKRQK